MGMVSVSMASACVGFACPIVRNAGVFGKRWTLQLVDQLSVEPRSFNDLKRSLHGITPSVLSQRLGELERAGFVKRRELAGTPARVEYALARASRDVVACWKEHDAPLMARSH